MLAWRGRRSRSGQGRHCRNHVAQRYCGPDLMIAALRGGGSTVWRSCKTHNSDGRLRPGQPTGNGAHKSRAGRGRQCTPGWSGFPWVPGGEALPRQSPTISPPKIASQPGCGGVTAFGDDGDGEYGIFVLWDSQAHAAAAVSIIRPILDKHLSGTVQASPEARLYEVISGSQASPAS